MAAESFSELNYLMFSQDFEGQVVVSTSWDSDRPTDDDHIPLYVLWNVPGWMMTFVVLQTTVTLLRSEVMPVEYYTVAVF